MDEKNMILFILFKFEIHMVINLTRRHEINMAFKSVKSEIALQKLAMGNRR